MPDLFIVAQQSKPCSASDYVAQPVYLAETNITDATADITVKDLIAGEFDDRAVAVYRLTDVTKHFRDGIRESFNKDGHAIPAHLERFMAE